MGVTNLITSILQSKKMFFENRFKLQEYLNSDQGALGQKRKSRVEQVVRDFYSIGSGTIL